jgi:acyl-CoA-binding protein
MPRGRLQISIRVAERSSASKRKKSPELHLVPSIDVLLDLYFSFWKNSISENKKVEPSQEEMVFVLGHSLRGQEMHNATSPFLSLSFLTRLQAFFSSVSKPRQSSNPFACCSRYNSTNGHDP